MTQTENRMDGFVKSSVAVGKMMKRAAQLALMPRYDLDTDGNVKALAGLHSVKNPHRFAFDGNMVEVRRRRARTEADPDHPFAVMPDELHIRLAKGADAQAVRRRYAERMRETNNRRKRS